MIELQNTKREQLAHISRTIIQKTFDVIANEFPPEAIHIAWSEFQNSPEVITFDPNTSEYVPFMAWFHYCWQPQEIYPPVPPIDVLLDASSDLTDDEYSFAMRCWEESFSFYEVRSVMPGQEMMIYDLLRNKKVNVAEKTASALLSPGDIFWGMAFKMNDTGFLVASSDIAFPSTIREGILKFRQQLGFKNKMTTQDLSDCEREVLHFYRKLYELAVAVKH